MTNEVSGNMSGCVLCMYCCVLFVFFFFFQAEDGIRYLTVTGVQTCALPILRSARFGSWHWGHRAWRNQSELPLPAAARTRLQQVGSTTRSPPSGPLRNPTQIGRASCRERV